MRTGASEKRLDLENLPTACPRLTAAAGPTMAEAATVCLEERGHGREVALQVTGEFAATYLLQRPVVTEPMRASYDAEEATEFGACGIAILVIRDETGWTVQRAFKGDGFDYWLGTVDEARPFQNMARLEISWNTTGDESRITTRLKEKRAQVRARDLSCRCTWQLWNSAGRKREWRNNEDHERFSRSVPWRLPISRSKPAVVEMESKQRPTSMSVSV